MNPIKNLIVAAVLTVSPYFLFSQRTKEKSGTYIVSNESGNGLRFKMEFTKGKSFNNPTFAIWLEEVDGSYMQLLFITKSLATGVYKHGEAGRGKWKKEPGEARRKATLPYFLHKRGVMAPDSTYLPTPSNPVPDAYTGATPAGNFIVQTRSDKPIRGKFRLLFEVNQSWDWNAYWHNNRFPGDTDYMTSCQPALVYSVEMDPDSTGTEYFLKPIGHSHYSGKDGKLYKDLSTITTALQIFETIKVGIGK